MKRKLALFLILLLLTGSTALSAKTVISGLSWESAPKSEGKKRYAPYSKIKQFHIKGLAFDRLRTVVSLNNTANKKEMGLVIRYAFRLKIKNEASNETFWEVPYYADELRVPIVKAGITQDAKIISLKLKEQLKRLEGTGFIPEALKLEVMLSPRKGVSEDGRIDEIVLPLKYEAAPRKKVLPAFSKKKDDKNI